MTGISWSNEFDDGMVDSTGLAGMASDSQFEKFDLGFSDNLDLPFSLVTVLNWH